MTIEGDGRLVIVRPGCFGDVIREGFGELRRFLRTIESKILGHFTPASVCGNRWI
jgi:hypothetical protein